MMPHTDHRGLEGTQVLERLAEIGQVDAFLDAVDSEDSERAAALMAAAGLDTQTIAAVLRQVRAGDDDP